MTTVQNLYDLPFGLIIENHGMFGVLISSYPTDEFKFDRSVPGVFDWTRSIPAGVLSFEASEDGKSPGCFHYVEPDAFEKMVDEATMTTPERNMSLARSLLQGALVALESGRPKFFIPRGACSPVPNFMQPREWPKIAALIRDWLAEHPE